MNQKNQMRTTVIAVVALVIAVAAGALAWTAYDRTGADFERRVQQEITKQMSGTSQPTDANSEADSADVPSTDTPTVPQTQP